MTKKRTAVDELRSIDDAIERSILDASAEELRDELAQDGLDWDKLVAETDALIADSKSQAGRLRLSRAREELKAFQAKPAEGPVDRAGHRTRLNRMRAGAESQTCSRRSSVSARWAPRLSRASAWISSTITVSTDCRIARDFAAVTIR